MRDYSDIIDLPRPEKLNHPRMTRTQRAAQFSPFAALQGFDEALKEAEKVSP